MSYPPNVDAVSWFCDQILPRLRHQISDLCFKIVGHNPHPKVVALGERVGVEVIGKVDDVRPYLAEALAVVVPLRSGGGTRLKILEAMALGRPVVSTSLGAEGLDISPGENILIADKPKQFVDHIRSLTASPQVAHHIGHAGRRLVVERYDWQKCLQRLDTFYGTLLGQEGT